jgi:uracil-DNA glycosylase family 4
MRGFFSGEEVVHRVRKTRGMGNSEEKQPIDPCEQCGLYKDCIHPRMEVTGSGQKGILIIAEAPSRAEDEQGIQLIGEAGHLLRECLEELGYDLDRDFWKTNIVNCRPPSNRKPLRKEMKCCFPRIHKTIQELKPSFIWLLGSSALAGFFVDSLSGVSISTYRRRCIPYGLYNCWVIPLFHPSFILRNNPEVTVDFFVRDLKWALSCGVKGEVRVFDPSEYVKVLTHIDDIKKVFQEIKNRKIVAFDYETSSLNPYRTGQLIWSIGVALSSTEAYSFGYSHPDSSDSQIEVIEKEWREILEDESIQKIAHNLKFEDSWSRQIFKVVPKGWVADTMTDQHILDDRRGTTGLKFQSFVRWGVLDYSKDVDRFMSSESNGLNKLDQVPLSNLCLYNGSDALLTFKLFEEQTKDFQRFKNLKRARDFFLEGVLAFCDIEEKGIAVDSLYFREEEKRLTLEIEKSISMLMSSKEAKLFKEINKRELSLNSSKDLRELFYKILAYTPPKTTDSGVASVDFKALNQLNTPFVVDLLGLRKLLKIRDTYLSQFKREEIKDRIHPSFNLHIAESYRSSSQNPNFQNIPIRDQDAKRTIRRGIVPSLGNKLMEVDYSAIEVRIAACYTHDPKLIEYINDPSTDMHRDQACELFKLRKNQVHKDIRFYAKNGFVFPQFYGSTYYACASNLWEEAKNLKTVQEIPLLDHLKKKGITNYYRFEDHARRWRRISGKSFLYLNNGRRM